MRRSVLSASLALASMLVAPLARAGNVLQPMSPSLDPPTLVALGVYLPIAGDDDMDAAVAVRFRVAGTSAWTDAMPLFRVHPEYVVGMPVAPAFAGSIFDLRPATTYEIELHATDPDGFDQTFSLTGTTRPVPADPASPNPIAVSDASGLAQALGSAKPGDVITLANGTYAGPFSIQASGTEGAPIVIRGETEDGVVLDGGGCPDCNVLEIYGSHVHVERLSLAHANRGLRWQGSGADGNVLRRVHVVDVTLGNGTKDGQTNFYICDNVFEGRLVWPMTYADDGGQHASDEGIVATGTGHVVCHNRVSGFGDALNTDAVGAVSNDFYGNEILFTYDDGLEFDESLRNVRAFRNRFTNTYDTLSFQPIFGGPVYAFRNVVVNVANEEMKLHALGSTGGNEVPVGVHVTNNTFVRPYHAIQISTSDTVHDYALTNNLFVGPAAPTDGLTVMWDTPIDFASGAFDYDGYFPEGKFELGYGPTGMTYASFADLVAGGRYEQHGTLLDAATFANGLAAPSDHHPMMMPTDVALADASAAIDRGVAVPQITDGFHGAAPDLGALELGCPAPLYGPRPDGVDESNEPLGCAPTGSGGSGGAASGGTGGSTSSGGAAGTSFGGSMSSGGKTGVGGATGGGATGGTAGAAGTHPTGGSGGGSPTGGAGGANVGAGASSATGGATTLFAPANSTENGDSGGCGCVAARSGASNGSLAFLALVGASVARRKRRARG